MAGWILAWKGIIRRNPIKGNGEHAALYDCFAQDGAIVADHGQPGRCSRDSTTVVQQGDCLAGKLRSGNGQSQRTGRTVAN